jgi:hypothetical protein
MNFLDVRDNCADDSELLESEIMKGSIKKNALVDVLLDNNVLSELSRRDQSAAFVPLRKLVFS